MPNKILLVWDENPDQIRFFILEEGTELAEWALASAGLYINGDDIEDGHPIHKLSEAIGDKKIESFDGKTVIEGPFSKVVSCGFYL